MKPYQPAAKLVVRDSLDDEYSDEVEDDVFIRDGKSKHAAEENGLKRPLMAPRRGSVAAGGKRGHRAGSGGSAGVGGHHKAGQSNAVVAELLKRRTRCWRCCEPFCYGCVALSVVVGVIVFASVLLTMFPMPLHRLQVWVNNRTAAAAAATSAAAAGAAAAAAVEQMPLFFGEEVPCTVMRAQPLWSAAFARLNSESPVRKVDVSGDGVLDVVFGFGLDDSFEYDEAMVPRCPITTTTTAANQPSQSADDAFCEGGVLALDGVSGAELWRRWTAFNVFSLFCTVDLNGDERADCVAAGRGGLVIAIDGRNGSVLWRLADTAFSTSSASGADETTKPPEPIIDLYTVNVIRDLNDDGVPEICAVHVEERDAARTGHIRLISGRDGGVLRTMRSPNDEEVFVPIQPFTMPDDGAEALLITTGGQNSPGGLYLLPLARLEQGRAEYTVVLREPYGRSGFMVPPVLSDVNGDDVEDVVLAGFNATVYALDGRAPFRVLWTHTFAASETVSSLVPGHYNNDNVTDFMCKYNTGPGFPVYYYSQTQILDGRDGSGLLEGAILDAGGPYSLLGGLPIAQTLGGDHFLHWQTQCGHTAPTGEAYKFVPDSDIVQQSRADTCRLRHNASTTLNLHVLSRHVQSPGAVIFSTEGMELQLNRSQQQPQQQQQPGAATAPAPDTQNAPIGKSPIKHPKMRKLPQQQPQQQQQQTLNKELLQRSENNRKVQQQQQLQQQQQQQRQRPSVVMDEETAAVASAGNGMMMMNNNNNNDDGRLNPFLTDRVYQQQDVPALLDYAGTRSRKVLEAEEMLAQQQQLQLQQQQQLQLQQQQFPNNNVLPPGEYESYFNFDQEGRIPVAMRSRYSVPSARDIRSKTARRIAGELDDRSNTEQHIKEPQQPQEEYDPVVMPPPMPPVQQSLLTPTKEATERPRDHGTSRAEHRNTLWDLEIEREMNEAKKAQRGADVDFQTKTGVRRRRRRRRRQVIVQADISGDGEPQKLGAVIPPQTIRDFLPSVASTGVLLPTLPMTVPKDGDETATTTSSVDFVFVLNVRESETQPPLLLPVDLACVEEKLTMERDRFGDLTDLKLRMLEQKFLRVCLRQRLAVSMPARTVAPNFESQIVVTRLRIQCGCDTVTLKDGEVCARLQPIEQQKWTGFMGDSANGLY